MNYIFYIYIICIYLDPQYMMCVMGIIRVQRSKRLILISGSRESLMEKAVFELYLIYEKNFINIRKEGTEHV